MPPASYKTVAPSAGGPGRRPKARLRPAVAAILVAAVAVLAPHTSCTGTREETIKVAAVLPLTGPLAFFGEPERAVLLQAVSELNAGGAGGIRGRKVELLIEDSRGSARDGVSAVQKVLIQKPEAVITSLTVISGAAQPVLAEAKTPQVALSVHPELARQNRNTVRPYYGFEQEMQVLADYFVRSGKLKVGVLWVLVPECEVALNNVLIPRLKGLGGEVVASENYSFADLNVRPQLAKIVAAEPDVILVIDFGNLFGLILKEADNMGVREKIVGNIGLLTAPAIDPTLLEGVAFAGPSFVINDSPTYREFAQRFKSFTKLDATYDVLYTRDAFDMLVKALDESMEGERVNRGKLFARLRGRGSFEGVAGRMTIDPDSGNVSVDIGMGVYRDGKIRPLP